MRTKYLCQLNGSENKSTYVAYSYPCALSIIVVKVMVKVTQQRIMGNKVNECKLGHRDIYIN